MEKAIKLSEWAEKHGINYQTAYRWYKAGKLPAKNIIKTPTGTILVEELETFTDRDEAIMTDETQPIARRLASAYKFIQSQENNKIFKHDLKECASNIFGDEKTFMNRVRTYCRHDFIEFLEKVVNNSKTIEEIKEKINTLKYQKEQQEL